MTALKNPYISNDYQNFLIRKNYNVIKSSEKSSNEGYSSNQRNQHNNYQNHRQNINTELNLRNPHKSNPFVDQNQANRTSTSHYKYLASYYTKQTLGRSRYMDSLGTHNVLTPYNSNTRPISVSPNTSLTRNYQLGRSNVSLENKLNKNSLYSSSLKFITSSNQWNTEIWRKQQEKQQRSKLKLYGPQALRYSPIQSARFNQEYYSTNPSQTSQKPSAESKKFINEPPRKQSFETEHQCYSGSFRHNPAPTDPPHVDSYLNPRKSRKDSFKQGTRVDFAVSDDPFDKIQSKLENLKASSRLTDSGAFSMYNSKVQEHFHRPREKEQNGPLNLNAFDSDHEHQQYNTSDFRHHKQAYEEDHFNPRGSFGAPFKDREPPIYLEFRNQVFHKLAL